MLCTFLAMRRSKVGHENGTLAIDFHTEKCVLTFEISCELLLPSSEKTVRLSFIEISIEAGILLGGKHTSCLRNGRNLTKVAGTPLSP